MKNEVAIVSSYIFYSGGDHVKFLFPMSFSLTLLSWGGIDYKDGYKTAEEWSILLDTVKWGTDFIMKCHVAENELYVQVRRERKMRCTVCPNHWFRLNKFRNPNFCKGMERKGGHRYDKGHI